MKDRLIRRMYGILILVVLAVSVGVYCIAFAMFYRFMITDIRDRANGVREYIEETAALSEFAIFSEEGGTGFFESTQTQEMLDRLRGVGNLKRLYYAKEEASGAIVTTSGIGQENDGEFYVPAGELAADLRRSLHEGVALQSERIYPTADGGAYAVFWPVLDDDLEPLGVVCMEFDVDAAYLSYRSAAVYCLALSTAFIILFSVIAYLSMNKVSESLYQKLAYTDFLTGCENRLAFEQRMRECEELVARGGLVTMLIFDLNNLKIVNDVKGHKTGDLYLQHTAKTLAEHLGSGAKLYRIGGDEFAALLTDFGERESEALLYALEHETKMMVPDLPFSCACGAATFTQGLDRTLRDVFGRADAAMYQHKKRQKAGMTGDMAVVRQP